MSQTKMLPPAEYKWMFKCNKKSTLNCKEIAAIYDVRPATLDYRIQAGHFPPADFKSRKMSGIVIRKWNVLTVLKQVLIDVKKGQIDQYAEQIGV
jgi:hypothetical protein